MRIAYSSPNEYARGSPTGVSTSPLIRWGAASAFMLRSKPPGEGLPLHLNVIRSPALDMWTLSLSLSFLTFYLLCLHHATKSLSYSHRPGTMGRSGWSPNVILMALFALLWLWFIAIHFRCPPRCPFVDNFHKKSMAENEEKLDGVIRTALKAACHTVIIAWRPYMLYIGHG